jgi:GTPase involved in cell partitioning and DNA repair
VEQYSSVLQQKSALIVGNKCDEVSDGSRQAADALRAASGMPVYCVSAKMGTGMESLKIALSEV